MTQMNTDYHDDLIMKEIFAFFASLREIIEFFQWTHEYFDNIWGIFRIRVIRVMFLT